MRVWFFLLAAGGPSLATAGDAEPKEQWPAMEPGVWQSESSRTLPNGKIQKWKEMISACDDPAKLLRGYWGPGRLAEAGCQYEAFEVSANQFTIRSECMILHGEVAKGTATVEVKNARSFELHAEVIEGKKRYRASRVGRLQAPCPTPEGPR